MITTPTKGITEMLTTRNIALAAALFALTACASSARQPEATKASGPSDAEIAAIVMAANSVDADMGDLAATRASSAEVRQFGKTMSTDHRAVNQAAGELVARLKVTPAENAISRKLQTDGNAVRAELSNKTGIEFDRAYMTHEVEYHKAVIAAVDQVLIPNADNAELKLTIISVRPALVAHLEHAEKLLAGLK
jgi:putative membrane protein